MTQTKVARTARAIPKKTKPVKLNKRDAALAMARAATFVKWEVDPLFAQRAFAGWVVTGFTDLDDLIEEAKASVLAREFPPPPPSRTPEEVLADEVIDHAKNGADDDPERTAKILAHARAMDEAICIHLRAVTADTLVSTSSYDATPISESLLKTLATMPEGYAAKLSPAARAFQRRCRAAHERRTGDDAYDNGDCDTCLADLLADDGVTS